MEPDSEQPELRVYGAPGLPTLVYLPGLHGDWTLIGPFRRALRGRVRFVEMTYPRTLTWSLDEHAAAIESALGEKGITGGWLLGESYGSQVLWPLVQRKRFAIQGIILAGGFVRHPMLWGVRLAERLCGAISLAVLVRLLFGYARIARWRHRGDPEIEAALAEFLARRTERDKRAAQHRLSLIARTDPGAMASQAQAPVYGITGLWDPIVPWPPVRRWLRKNCPTLRAYQIVARSDHNVLNNAAEESAECILGWMGVKG